MPHAGKRTPTSFGDWDGEIRRVGVMQTAWPIGLGMGVERGGGVIMFGLIFPKNISPFGATISCLRAITLVISVGLFGP